MQLQSMASTAVERVSRLMVQLTLEGRGAKLIKLCGAGRHARPGMPLARCEEAAAKCRPVLDRMAADARVRPRQFSG